MIIVLDLDDTLYYEYDYFISGLHAIADYFKQDFDGQAFIHAAKQYYAHDIPSIDAGLQAIQRSDLQQQALTVYRHHQPTLKLLDDSQWFLSHYANKQTLCLITDGRSEGQWAKIHALGIEAYFAKIIVTGDYDGNYAKPHPRAFRDIMAQFGKQHDYIYIGDNPAIDFTAPASLHWLPSLRIRRPKGRYRQLDANNIACVPNFFDIARLLFDA